MRSSLLRKARNNKKAVAKGVAVIAALVVIVIGVIVIGNIDFSGGSGKEIDAADLRPRILYNDQWYALRDDVDSALLIGIDKYGDEAEEKEGANLNNQQCDFLILLIIDHGKKEYNLLHINRDTMTEVRELGLNNEVIGTNFEQICLAHTYGTGGKDSCRNTVKAVENLLYDINVGDFVAFTMDVVPILNDKVGGVTVHVEDDFAAGTKLSEVKGQDYTLQGEEALTYVRARSSMLDDTTNVNRMKRQRQFISGLRDAAKAKMEKSEKWAAETLLEISDYLTTDYVREDLTSLAKILTEYKQSDILTIEGETVTTDYVEFYPNEEALQAQVVSLFYEPVEQ